MTEQTIAEIDAQIAILKAKKHLSEIEEQLKEPDN